MKRILALALALLLVFALFSGCTQKETAPTPAGTAAPAPAGTAAPAPAGTNAPAAPAETVKIGVLLPLSGPISYAGELQLSGIQMCVDYANERTAGPKIELVIADHAGDVQTGITEYERLRDAGVSGILGTYLSTVGAAVQPLAVRDGVPLVICNTTAETVLLGTAPNKYAYRTNVGQSDGAFFDAYVFEWLGKKLPAGKVQSIAFLYDTGDWGQGSFKSYSNTCAKLGIDIVVAEPITTDSADLSSVVNKIKAADPDLIVGALLINDALLITRQMAEYQCDVPILGLSGGFLALQYLDNVGEAGNYVMATGVWSPWLPGAKEEAVAINEEFKAKNGYDITMEMAWGWLAAGAMCQAVEDAGSGDREAIADALYVMDLDSDHYALLFSLYDGVKFNTAGDVPPGTEAGKTRYNQNTELGASAGLVIVQAQEGEWTLCYPLDNIPGGVSPIIFPIPSYAER